MHEIHAITAAVREATTADRIYDHYRRKRYAQTLAHMQFAPETTIYEENCIINFHFVSGEFASGRFRGTEMCVQKQSFYNL